MLAPGLRWCDDWFALQELAPCITAIGEPKFHQDNWSYLLEGRERALLFDSGTGIRDITPVIGLLASKPVTVLASHLHYDHTGNLHRFGHIAMADLPELRRCEENGIFVATDDLFLGGTANVKWHACSIEEWWQPSKRIDLGGRTVELLHTPGHSPDSVALWDPEAELLFIADYIYPGSLYAQIPGANLADYEATANMLLKKVTQGTRLFAAHGNGAGGHQAPELNMQDIVDLKASLEALRQSGKKPETWPVNANIRLLLGPAAFAAWQNTSQPI